MRLALAFLLLAQHPQWLALIHYKSAISGPNFFLSKAANPDEEFAATLTALQSPEPKSDQHAQCRFPARFAWIKSQLPQIQFPKISCPRLAKWKQTLRPQRATLLFASAYLNNPSSMYGHTFLRLSRTTNPELAQPLLDYAISFGANTQGSSGLAYVWNGLFGGFSGSFETAPFYLKVQEYNNSENRDFWEYSLNLTTEQLDFLIDHLWELREAQFSYYFLSKNCSYYLLELLDVVNPRWELTKPFPFWVIPADTIRRLYEKNLITGQSFRPSRRRKVEYRRSLLTNEERKLAFHLQSQEQIKKFSTLEQAKILDTAYEFFRYRTKEGIALSATEKQEQTKLLTWRSSLKEPENPLPDFKQSPPEAGHKTGRLGITGGTFKKNTVAEFSARAALHDLLSNSAGFQNFSQLETANLRLRLEQKQLFIDEFTLIKIRSLTPFDSWFQPLAWSFAMGQERVKAFDCRAWNCSSFYLRGGPGISFLLSKQNIFFFLAELSTAAGPAFDKHYQIGVRPIIGFNIPVFSWWRMQEEFRYSKGFLGDMRNFFTMIHEEAFSLSKNQELRISFEETNKKYELLGGFYYYL